MTYCFMGLCVYGAVFMECLAVNKKGSGLSQCRLPVVHEQKMQTLHSELFDFIIEIPFRDI
jgi:hypothetical protein